MSQLNILIVEDREDWQDIVQCAVEAEGHTPVTAGSYEAAVAALQNQPFNLVIIDPVLDRHNRFNRDGLSVVQKVCELQPGVPVLIITGFGNETLERTALADRCCDAIIAAQAFHWFDHDAALEEFRGVFRESE